MPFITLEQYSCFFAQPVVEGFIKVFKSLGSGPGYQSNLEYILSSLKMAKSGNYITRKRPSSRMGTGPDGRPGGETGTAGSSKVPDGHRARMVDLEEKLGHSRELSKLGGCASGHFATFFLKSVLLLSYAPSAGAFV